MKRTILYNIIVFIIAGIFICLLAAYHNYIPVSSDTTTTLPMSEDILKGNIFLSDWILGSNNFYFTEIIPYALGLFLGLEKITLLYWIPAIAWVVFYLSIFAFISSDLDEMSSNGTKVNKKIYIVYTICLLLMVAPVSTYTLLNANSHNNLYAFCSLYFIVLSYYINTKKVKWLIPCLIISTALVFSEGVTLMVLIAPIVMLCLINFYGHERKTYMYLLLVDFFSFFLGQTMINVVEYLGGMETRGFPVGISDFQNIHYRIYNWIDQFSVLLGLPEYFNYVWCLKKFAATIFMLFFVVSLIYYTINIFKISWKLQLLYGITTINLVSCIFTDVPVHYRYIVPSFYFGFVLTGVFLCNIWKKATIRIVAIVLCVCSLFMGGIKIYDIFRLDIANRDTKNLANMIVSNDLGNGYGDFWCASVVSFYTDYSCNIVPIHIMPQGQFIQKYGELIKTEWYDEKDIHYIISYNDESSTFINTDNMYKICGMPTESFSVGNYILYYWDKDISQYLN